MTLEIVQDEKEKKVAVRRKSNLRIISMFHISLIGHAAIMFGQFDVEYYRRNEKQQAEANGEPEAILCGK